MWACGEHGAGPVGQVPVCPAAASRADVLTMAVPCVSHARCTRRQDQGFISGKETSILVFLDAFAGPE